MLQKDLAAALGISGAMVSRLVRRGMPTKSLEAAQRWRRRHLNPAHVVANRWRRGDEAVAPTSCVEEVATPAAAAHEPADSIWTSRARREAAEAGLAELRLAELRSALVSVAAIRAALAKKATALLDAFLQIPDRAAPGLAAETDQARCHDILQSEIHAVLAQTTAAAPPPAATEA